VLSKRLLPPERTRICGAGLCSCKWDVREEDANIHDSISFEVEFPADAGRLPIGSQILRQFCSTVAINVNHWVLR
jgi:hypothetical protein